MSPSRRVPALHARGLAERRLLLVVYVYEFGVDYVILRFGFRFGSSSVALGRSLGRCLVHGLSQFVAGLGQGVDSFLNFFYAAGLHRLACIAERFFNGLGVVFADLVTMLFEHLF